MKPHLHSFVVGICRTALPPEYSFSIPKSEFSPESSWLKTEHYVRGNLAVETRVSLYTDDTLPTQQWTTSAVIVLIMQNRKPKCKYDAKVTATLYDENIGCIFKESTEEGKIDDGSDCVKFTVGVGMYQDIERTQSKRLQLQVKVQVDEKELYKSYWEKLVVSSSVPHNTKIM